MIYIEDTIVEIEAGSVDDQTAQEVYRNLQVLYGTETGEQALDREFGIDINILDNPQEAAKALLTAEFVRKTNSMSHGSGSCVWNGPKIMPGTAASSRRWW